MNFSQLHMLKFWRVEKILHQLLSCNNVKKIVTFKQTKNKTYE